MKKRVFVAAVIVVCIAMLAAGTVAYFTDDVVTHNIITSGEIDISIVEVAEENALPIKKDGKIIGYSFADLLPDMTVKKDVKVSNDASEPAWIRVKLAHTITGKDGKTTLENVVDGVEMVQYAVPAANADKWVEHEGWYYYTEPLAAKAQTVSVMENVLFAKEMDNDYMECKVELTVKAEAVQAKNNPIPEGKAVYDIPGWPNA